MSTKTPASKRTANRTKISPTKARQFADSATANERLWDADVKGLHLKAYGEGRAVWIYRYKSPITSRWREMKVGPFPENSVSVARSAATHQAGKIANGIDPIESQRETSAKAERQKRETVQAFLEGPYALYLSRRKGGDSTRQMILNHFSDWLARSISSLTQADLSAWQANREKAGTTWGTIKRTWEAMRALLNYAALKGTVETNPLKGYSLEKPALSDDDLAQSGDRRYLEAHEVKALFKGIDAYQEQKRQERRNSRQHGKSFLPDLDNVPYADHVAPWMLTMFYTGFRPGDLFGLRWEHVDLNFKNVRKIIEKTAHHDDKPRQFPLSDKAVDVLKAWWEQQGKPATGYVFASARTDGGRMDKNAMQKPWKRVKQYGGLPEGLHLYTLRHHFASTLVMMGVDLLTVSRLMAHTDIQTTIQHYGHLQPNKARDVVNQFAGHVQGAGRKSASKEKHAG